MFWISDLRWQNTTGHFVPKKYSSLVFYDNRNLKISKSKKSEQYFRDKIEIFLRHFESHWRETWRHTGRRTVPQISLETPPPPPPPPPPPLGFFSKPLIFSFWRNTHDQYTYPLARPLMIYLQVVRTSFGFHLRECMGSSFPPPPPVMCIMFRDKSIIGIFKFPFSGGLSLHLHKMVEETLIIIIHELIVRNLAWDQLHYNCITLQETNKR